MRTLVEQFTRNDDLILDFFAGSCTLAQAVWEVNSQDDNNRRFIMIQLPEPLEFPKTLDTGLVLNTVADIGKERMRRVIAQMQAANGGQLLLLDTRAAPEDLGFKVFKLSSSHFQPWQGVDEHTLSAYARQMELFHDPLVEGWQAENTIYEIALREGYGLNCRIEPISPTPQMGGKEPGLRVYRVTDPDNKQSFAICLADRITLADLHGLNLSEDDTFICRDAALDDESAANLALQCELKTI
jgi:adenine-specific DNA-methyltransferase